MYKILRNGVTVQQQYGTGKYPFLTMEVGDTFKVSFKNNLLKRPAVQKSASLYGKEYGRKFKTYTLDNDILLVKRVK